MSKINTGYSLNECPPMKETILYSIQQIIVAVFNVIPVPLLIGAGIGPSIAQYETEEILKATVDFATSNDIMVHGHLAESRHEAEFTYEKFGCSPVKWFYNHDLLGERFYYAHCIHLDDEDIRIMADTKTGVSSCPVSNMYLSSGACRIKDLMSTGVGKELLTKASSRIPGLKADIE